MRGLCGSGKCPITLTVYRCIPSSDVLQDAWVRRDVPACDVGKCLVFAEGADAQRDACHSTCRTKVTHRPVALMHLVYLHVKGTEASARMSFLMGLRLRNHRAIPHFGCLETHPSAHQPVRRLCARLCLSQTSPDAERVIGCVDRTENLQPAHFVDLITLVGRCAGLIDAIGSRSPTLRSRP